MKPTVQQMIDASQQALRDYVAPTVTDQWAASALRSVDVILSHLLARVAGEGPMLFEDNADLAETLAAASASGLAADGIASRIDDFRTRQSDLSIGYPAVDQLLDLNLVGRTLVDELLVACHARKGAAQADDLHARLRAYLDRHLERERAYFFPVYVGRPV
ncbi:hypothetical protein [Sphingosinicella terrae]|uniref:hypothetical protein n=1 Tax=Sphingosinicella terrae TaxID=2172047 RepID=UPI000E0DD1DB|nr:hypothetical protein [Sphingosinicella terrae]